jgi:hypothetical protein
MDALPVPTCLVCRKPLSELPTVTCQSCETAIHTECHEYLGGCGRFACVEAASPRMRVVKYLDSRIREWSIRRVGGLAYMVTGWLRVCYKNQLDAVMLIILAVMAIPFLGLFYRDRSRRRALNGAAVDRKLLGRLLTSYAAKPRNEEVERLNVLLGYALGCAGALLALWDFKNGNFGRGIDVGLLAIGVLAMSQSLRRGNAAQVHGDRMATLWHDELTAVVSQVQSPTDEMILIGDGAAEMKNVKAADAQ